MSTETGRSSTESEAASGLDYEETELTLRLPGGVSRGRPSFAGAGGGSEQERRRSFAGTVDLRLGSSGTGSGRRDLGDRSDESPNSRASAAEKPPAAKARVVGWPPVRSYRKNVLKNCVYVKVAVDGVPYLRKVDLETCAGYQELLTALQEMFASCFTIRNGPDEKTRLVNLVSGMEYVPTYEDKDGDWMMVGDVPWKMFVESCKRVRLMKSSEAVNLGDAPRASQ